MFIVVNFDVILQMCFMSWHPKLAGQWPTQMSYEKMLRIQKECCQPYDFCRVADMLARDSVYTIFIIELWNFAFIIKWCSWSLI